MKLHLGCGRKRKKGFVNVDIQPGKAVDIVSDLTKPGALDQFSEVERIESYHFIEHIHRRDARRLLEDCFSTLSPGGVLILELPDLEQQCKRLLAGDFDVVKNIYGLQRKDRPVLADIHRWGWTPRSMTETLSDIGFIKVKALPGTDYHSKTEPSMRLEAVRP